MGFWNKVRGKVKNLFTKKEQPRELAFTIGQKTRPSTSFRSIATSAIVGRDYREYQNKDLTEMRDWSHETILKVLRKVSPETSMAVTTFLRTFDSGYSITAKKANGEINQNATNLLFKSVSRITAPDDDRFSLPNDINSLSLKFAIDALFKGGFCGELVFDKRLIPQTISYVDAWSIDFMETTTGRNVPYQLQEGEIVPFDYPNFVYIPVDPMGDDPYGEEQIASAIQPILFKAMVMQDLQRVVHVNGWQRMTFKVLEEAIAKNIPPTMKSPDEKRNMVSSILNEIKTDYENIDPDANIIHTDAIEVDRLEAGGGVMFEPKALLDVIDNQIANGLKTFSVLLSKKFGGGSEGFTSAETVLYIKLVAGYQNLVEKFFERMFTMILRYEHGIIANVEFKFKKPELRTEQEMSQWLRVMLESITSAYNEQAIGKKEKAKMIRQLFQLDAVPPPDISEERILNNKPNEPERPSSSEEDKENKREETNRSRRSGNQE